MGFNSAFKRLISTLDGGGYSASGPGRSTLSDKPQDAMDKRLDSTTGVDTKIL